MIWDLICVGGGAAGFFAAIAHAEQGGGATLILEKSPETLSKVKISGGGRCNVTHSCFEPRALCANYPRGQKALRGALHRFGVQDAIDWFAAHGVELKTEDDGRMFPVTDRSQTIIDCLEDAASKAGVEVRKRCGVASLSVVGNAEEAEDGDESGAGEGASRFRVETEAGEVLLARNVLLATGGTRLVSGAKLAEQVGHTLEPAVPSLFTFKIRDARLTSLPGVSVAAVDCKIAGSKLASSGPLLVTHIGVSGPGILKISAWGARELSDLGYRFTLIVNWLPGEDVLASLQTLREESGTRQIDRLSPFSALPKRLWAQLVHAAGVSEGQTWAELTKKQRGALVAQLSRCEFQVDGKSMNKDEFVTCGGVSLREIDFRTMESKRIPGLYFAGEMMDVDGVTGGFNFQNAWTSGYVAGTACLPAEE
ncbi:MAG: NAD(P)/FAD-dependent oxidoreductase [Myxococcota bacterium]